MIFRLGFIAVFLSVFLITASNAAGEPFKCQGNNTVQHPKNISETYWFPQPFEMYSPFIAANQSCVFNLIVPKGMYAYVQLTIAMNNDSSSYSIDYNGVTDTYYNSDNILEYFINPGATIFLNTGARNGRWGFSVRWYMMPSKFEPDNFPVNKSEHEPRVIAATTHTLAFLFTAETRVSLVGFLPWKNPSLHFVPHDMMKALVVFDGPDWNSPCLGNLYQIWKSKKQVVSTGNQLTTFFMATPWYGVMYYFVQDYENTKNFVEYQTLFYTSSDVFLVNLTATNGPAALSTYTYESRVDYLNTVYLEDDAQLDVYAGFPMADKSNWVASYDSKSVPKALPQVFTGSIRTYVLSKGKAMLNLIEYSGGYGNGFDGRRGFIASPYYKSGLYPWHQEELQTITGKIGDHIQLYNFKCNFQVADLAKNATMRFIIGNGENGNYSQYFDISNFAPTNRTIEAVGYYLEVNFIADRGRTDGFFMEYEMTAYNSAKGYGLYVVGFYIIYRMIFE